MYQIYNNKMGHFLVINGDKLIQDFLIVQYLVLLYLMLLIKLIKAKPPNIFSDVKILMDRLEEFPMPNHMQPMFFVVWEHLKYLEKQIYLINNYLQSGYAKDKLKKEGLMVDHRSYLMFVIHGGFIQLFVC